MIGNIPFSPHRPSAASPLPLTLVSLEDWGLVTLDGADSATYLQGQVTSDIKQLAIDHHVLCGHCDAKGKMWSNLRLFHYKDGFAYLVRRSVLSRQVAELKKYAVFSKVNIAPKEDVILLGLAGTDARSVLSAFFSPLPDAQHSVTHTSDTTLLHLALPSERFILITTADVAEFLINKLHQQAILNRSEQWLALEITAGYPIIDAPTSEQLLPQATNLQALEGISFTKGCYTGQEMVARAKYRGANKRALYCLTGTSSRVPRAGDELELQLGSHWRRTGTVLAATHLKGNGLLVQAVLSHDLDPNSCLRVKDDDDSQLAITLLPYSLAEK